MLKQLSSNQSVLFPTNLLDSIPANTINRLYYVFSFIKIIPYHAIILA